MRIISGSARGRTFDAPKGQATRPTTDRVKESLFGILQFRLQGTRVLDLFSGSGNLALESLSRGADFAVMNDADPQCARLIQANAKKLGFEGRSKVLSMDYAACLRMLGAKGEQFDFIFLDPPYRKGLDDSAAALIFELNLLKEGGCIVVEHGADTLPGVGEITDSRKYGDTKVSFLIRKEQE